MTHAENIHRLIDTYIDEQITSAVAPINEQLREAFDHLATTTRELETARTRIAELEAQTEPKQRTLFGACPEKPGGESLAAALRVVEKWGDGAAVRQFKGALTPPSADSRFGLVHTSYKPQIADVIAGRLDNQIRAVAEATPAGHVLEVWHEADKKVTDGVASYADLVAAKNRFYDVVKSVRPDVLVANTVTGWLTDPKSKGDVDRWGAVRADVFGIDCDGVRPTRLPYTNYEDETATALAFIDRHGYDWFAVPEFGCPRIPDADPDGTTRADYHQHYADLWSQTDRCLFVCLYEYDSSPNYSLTTPAEINQWRSLI